MKVHVLDFKRKMEGISRRASRKLTSLVIPSFLVRFIVCIAVSLNVSTLLAQPDDCSSVLDLATLSSPYSESTTGAANDFSFCVMNLAEDHIYYYDLPDASTLTIQQTTNNYDSRHSLRYGGACPGSTEIVCTDDPDTKVESWQNCTGSTQRVYWIQSGYSANDGNYTLSWSVTAGSCPVPPANDDCSAAIALTVNPDQACGTVTAGTIELATASSDANSCSGTDDDDVWYSFVATSTRHYVDLLNVAGSTTNLYHAVFTGVCGSLGAAVNCSDPNSSTLTGLTIGDTYYVRVYTWTATGGQTTTFDLC
ncbi:MAG: hypothetical protein JKY18_14005, partial [Flavobacteriales bacterium]|nr:hypothetical protein [Flavobacteriales bacterium]